MNYFDIGVNGDQDEEKFEDKPEEIDGQYDNKGNWIAQSAPPAEVHAVKPTRPAPAPAPEEIEEEIEEAPEEENDSEILIDARLRLEMGKLYEMIMKHDLFAGVDADPKAVKVVQKEFRAYAQERMEIMLGMRQEPSKESNAFPMDQFPFNSLEVEILKAIAATATKGESRDAEPFSSGPTPPPARTTLNPIGKGTSKTTPVAPKPIAKKPLATKPQAPVKRTSVKADEKIRTILEEEGLTMEEIDKVMDSNNSLIDEGTSTHGEATDGLRMKKMTEAEIVARNKEVSLRNKRAESPNKTPMPSADQLKYMYEQRAQANQSAQKPGWQQLIEMVKVMPPTLANNTGNE